MKRESESVQDVTQQVTPVIQALPVPGAPMTPGVPGPVSIPPDVMAQAQAELEKRTRAQRVAGIIQSILQKERCDISITVVLTPGGNQFQWGIVPLPLDNRRD